MSCASASSSPRLERFSSRVTACLDVEPEPATLWSIALKNHGDLIRARITPVLMGGNQMLRIASHIRVNTAWTAAVEKRLLVWIAERLPHWVTSDGLSLVGLAGMCGAGLSFAAFRITPWAAAAVVVSLVANWFGDSLDGTLARVRRQERPRFGYYVDHALDLAGTTVLMTGIA